MAKFGKAVDDGALFDEMVGRCSLMALGCGVFSVGMWSPRFFPSFFDSSSLLLSTLFLSMLFFFPLVLLPTFLCLFLSFFLGKMVRRVGF